MQFFWYSGHSLISHQYAICRGKKRETLDCAELRTFAETLKIVKNFHIILKFGSLWKMRLSPQLTDAHKIIDRP